MSDRRYASTLERLFFLGFGALAFALRDHVLVLLRLGLKHALQDRVAALWIAFRLVRFWSLCHAHSSDSITAQEAKRLA